MLRDAAYLFAQSGPVAITATTGKAAHLLSAEAGQTLHHFLQITPHALPERSRNTDPVGLLIVDECSMMDSALAGALGIFLRDTPCGHLVLSGDTAQLPPVGPGAPFWDLADEFPAAVVSLATNHRTMGRAIADLGTRIRDGSLTAEQASTPADCIHVVECPSSEIPDAVVREARRLIAAGVTPTDILVLTARHEGASGDNALARLLRPCYLPQTEPATPTRLFAVGDRVIQDRTATIQDQTILNGSFGTIEACDDAVVRVRFDWNGTVDIPIHQAPAYLRLAYTLTVHKAQGSQAPAVVVVLDPAHASSFTAPMTYTAITRAQEHLTLIGSPALLASAAQTITRPRLTLLRDKFAVKALQEVVH